MWCSDIGVEGSASALGDVLVRIESSDAIVDRISSRTDISGVFVVPDIVVPS